MTLSKQLSHALNEQINAEMWSANLYLSMSAHFAYLGMEGFAKWMKRQSTEELDHAYKFIDFIVRRDSKVELGQVNVVPTGFGTPSEIFEHVYEHEKHVTELIYKLMDLAREEKDYATEEFLHWYTKEQVEEEASAKAIADKLKLYGEHYEAILDHHLSK